MLIAIALSSWQERVVRVESVMNGSLAGLVAITASANVVTTPLAVIIGGTGAAVAHLVALKLQHWQIDDAVDGVAVHGGGGIWGTLCVAFFGQLDLIDTGLNRGLQLLTQCLGIVSCGLLSFGITWLVLTVVSRVYELRIALEDEEIGLNISEHHAKTETYDLFQVMDRQAKTHDLSLRVPVEPFTEIGHIAVRYNQVLEAFENRHHKSVEDLAQIYYVTAAIVAAIEHNSFKAEQLGLEEVCTRTDELGALARAIQSMAEALQDKERELSVLRQQLMTNLEPAIKPHQD
jgi:Amt family ammonium transporter